jgi:hypothetical protein
MNAKTTMQEFHPYFVRAPSFRQPRDDSVKKE